MKGQVVIEFDDVIDLVRPIVISEKEVPDADVLSILVAALCSVAEDMDLTPEHLGEIACTVLREGQEFRAAAAKSSAVN